MHADDSLGSFFTLSLLGGESMDYDSYVPKKGSECIKVKWLPKTKFKLEGLSWRISKKLFGLIWKIRIWSL